MKAQPLGEYQILGCVARGGMATICLAKPAKSLGLPPVVCLKTLRREFQNDEAFTLMLADEADIGMRLQHPNCIRTLAGGPGYVVMEYVVGETLDLLLRLAIKRGRPLLPAGVALVIASICDALHYAHELRIDDESYEMIHRDVSPENMIISDRGQVKLLDFGVAKARDRRQITEAGIVKGKFSYMSPEQMSAQPIDRRSDIYGLGVTLYSCLVNRRPFEKMDLDQLFDAKVKGNLPSASSIVAGLDPRLSKIADKAMARRSSDRFATAEEMAAALRTCVPPDASEHLATMLLHSVLEKAVAKKRAAFERLLAGEIGPEVLHGLRVVPIEPEAVLPRDGKQTEVIPPGNEPTETLQHLHDRTAFDPMAFDSDDETEERTALDADGAYDDLTAVNIEDLDFAMDDQTAHSEPVEEETAFEVEPIDFETGTTQSPALEHSTDFDTGTSTNPEASVPTWTIPTGPVDRPRPPERPPTPPPRTDTPLLVAYEPELVDEHISAHPQEPIEIARPVVLTPLPPKKSRLPLFLFGLFVGAALGFVMGWMARDPRLPFP